MGVTISDEVLRAANMTEAELRLELAVMLFERDRVTLAQAAKLAGMERGLFQHLLASRDIPSHYDVPEFEADLAPLREFSVAERVSLVTNDTG